MTIQARLAHLEARQPLARARVTREAADTQRRILDVMSDADLRLLEAGATPGATEIEVAAARAVWERAVRMGLDDPSVHGRRS